MYSEDAIHRIQTRLLELGYVQTGGPDGKMGPKTEAGILDFRNRNGLPLTAAIDAQFIEKLETAEKISLPVEQTQATPGDVSSRVRAVASAWWAKITARVTQWAMGILTLIGLVSPSLPTAAELLTPVRSFISELPWWVWTAGVGAIALAIATKAKSSEQALVEGYREGRVKNDPPAPGAT